MKTYKATAATFKNWSKKDLIAQLIFVKERVKQHGNDCSKYYTNQLVLIAAELKTR